MQGNLETNLQIEADILPWIMPLCLEILKNYLQPQIWPFFCCLITCVYLCVCNILESKLQFDLKSPSSWAVSSMWVNDVLYHLIFQSFLLLSLTTPLHYSDTLKKCCLLFDLLPTLLKKSVLWSDSTPSNNFGRLFTIYCTELNFTMVM